MTLILIRCLSSIRSLQSFCQELHLQLCKKIKCSWNRSHKLHRLHGERCQNLNIKFMGDTDTAAQQKVFSYWNEISVYPASQNPIWREVKGQKSINSLNVFKLSQSKSMSKVKSQKDLEWLYSAVPQTNWFKLKLDTLIQIKNLKFSFKILFWIVTKSSLTLVMFNNV